MYSTKIKNDERELQLKQWNKETTCMKVTTFIYKPKDIECIQQEQKWKI